MRLFFIFLKISLIFFFFLLFILIFQPLSLMPPLADPVMHFYGLFRKLPSASQPNLSSCLLGALHLRRELFWSDSSWFLLQPESQACSFLISICHSQSQPPPVVILFLKDLSGIESTRFVILPNLLIRSVGNLFNLRLHSFGFRFSLRSASPCFSRILQRCRGPFPSISGGDRQLDCPRKARP